MQGKVNSKIISKALRHSLILLLCRYLIGGSSLTEARNKLLAVSVLTAVAMDIKIQPRNYRCLLLELTKYSH